MVPLSKLQWDTSAVSTKKKPKRNNPLPPPCTSHPMGPIVLFMIPKYNLLIYKYTICFLSVILVLLVDDWTMVCKIK